MANFVHINLVDGVYIDGQVPGAGDFQRLDRQLFAAVDGDNGGSWSPTSPIVLGTDAIELGAPPGFIRGRTRSIYARMYGWEQSSADTLWQWVKRDDRGFYIPTTGMRSRSSGAAYEIPLGRQAHHGATLSNVRLSISVGAAHDLVPKYMPAIYVIRRALDGSGEDEYLHALTAGAWPKPETGALWYADGYVQSLDVACDRNNVIDSETYVYRVKYVDEYGTGAFDYGNGNYLVSLRLDFTAIRSLSFP